jgi:very-short-patch-repair endonuclease
MNGKVDKPDGVIASIAARQHGVVATAQLRRAGVSEDAIRARVLAGRFHRLHRGVYAVGHPRPALEGRLMAAVLAVGGGPESVAGPVLAHWGAAVSHSSAGYLWKLLPPPPGPVDVIVAGTSGKARREGIRLHRSVTLTRNDVTSMEGIPVTTPVRTIADLRRATAAGRPGAPSGRDLRRAIRQAGVLGLPIEEEDPGDRTRSDLEGKFLRLCRRHRLPPPEINVRVGPYLADFLWRRHRLVVETDFYIYHRGIAAFRDDRRRDLELRRRGYEVMRVSEEQLHEEADRVVDALRMALSAPGG